MAGAWLLGAGTPVPEVNPMNLMKTLSLAALLAALCALPTASADVDVDVNEHTVVCVQQNPIPPVTDPTVSVENCNVEVQGGPSPVTGCPPTPPVFRSVWIDSRCTVHVHAL